MEKKFRILEKKFEDHSEFHPQMLIGPCTYTPSTIKKLFGVKDIVHPASWYSLLLCTPDYKHGLSSKNEAEIIIEKYKNKKIIEEIIHEIN
jgi:hypothetical protein